MITILTASTASANSIPRLSVLFTIVSHLLNKTQLMFKTQVTNCCEMTISFQCDRNRDATDFEKSHRPSTSNVLGTRQQALKHTQLLVIN